ncbi:MAG: hypothetical protein HQK51_19580 [Oligoflexia bacterium]|nr:hypothetical protein [Oligoflexia bacterium]
MNQEVTINVEEYPQEKYWIEKATSNPFIKSHLTIYTPEETCVVLGRSSNLIKELNISLLLKDKVPLYRRLGGGASVVLDCGSLVALAVIPEKEASINITEHYKRFSDWIIAGLQSLNIAGVKQLDSCDLAIKNRKIAGACLYRTRNYVMYSVCLLIEANINLMERYLKHPPRSPIYRENRNHGNFVTSIKDVILSEYSVLYGIEIGEDKKENFTCYLQNVLKNILSKSFREIFA